jgi:hypothetical protein
MFKNQSGWINLAIVLVVMAFGVIMVGGYKKIGLLSPGDTTTIYHPIPEAPNQDKKSLQLKTLAFSTPAPTVTISPTTAPSPTTPSAPKPPVTQPPPYQPPPSSPPPSGNTCATDAPMSSPTCVCPGLSSPMLMCTNAAACTDDPYYPLGSNPSPYFPSGSCGYMKKQPGFEKHKNDSGCAVWCYAKPVIYLYPTIPTFVSVKLDIPGTVTVSDPVYPVNTGWQNVLAYPSGILTYHNQQYHYLYYETEVTKHVVPKDGMFIKRSELKPTLNTIIRKFGLNDFEAKEFMEYWLPRLNESTTPYMLFSVLTSDEKQIVDKVTISPTPQTFIHLLAYFKPVDMPYEIPALQVPTVIRARTGFTAVEWGGTIDSK